MRDVMALVRLSRPTIYALMAKGEFPYAMKIGRSIRWLKCDVEEWAKTKADEAGA